MRFAEIIQRIGDLSMDTPKLYGWFHILFLLLMIGGTYLLCRFFRNSSTKTMKIICLIVDIVLILLEVMKQLINSCTGEGFVYDWSSFPFQFCETPMYVLIAIMLNRNKKVQDVLISYMATFAFFGGFAVMICPTTVLNSSVFANVRSLIQHSLQVMIGIYLMSWNRKNFTLKNWAFSIIPFSTFCFIAIAINFIVEKNTGAGIAMFYLSQTQESAILIVRKIKPLVPFPVYVFCYMVGFTGCSFLSFMSETGIYRLAQRRNQKLTPVTNE